MNKIDFDIIPRLDMSDERLWRGDKQISLTPKTFAILSYLASRPNQLVTKHELLEAVWPTTYVVEDVIKHYIAELRRLLGDSASEPRFIENVRGRGYRFIGYIKIEKTIDSSNIQPIISVSSDPAKEPEVHEISPLKGIPIAVLPFANLSGDPRQKYFADGITADVITDLSRFNELRVVTVSPVIDPWKQSSSVTDLVKVLNVEYFLNGGVRRDRDQLRVTVQLIDAIEGYYLWTEAYDCKLTVGNIIDIQVDIAQKIVVAVANPGSGVLSLDRQRSAMRKGKSCLGVYDSIFRAHQQVLLCTQAAHKIARNSLEHAVEIDSDCADSWAWLSYIYGDEGMNLYNPLPEPWERAHDAVSKALKIDPLNQMANLQRTTHLCLERRDREVLEQAEKTVAINPNNAAILGDIAIWVMSSGYWEQGFELATKAAQLNPEGGVSYFSICRYHYYRGDYEKALDTAIKVNFPEMPDYWQHLAAAYGKLGRTTEARTAAAKLLELRPDFIEHAYEHSRQFSNSDEYIEDFIDGVRKAGLDIPPEK